MRTDIHRLAELDPANYEYQGWLYQGDSEAVWESLGGYLDKDPEFHSEGDLREDPNLFEGNWHDRGTCDCCGAHFAWGNVYKHIPTSETVVVGWICAGKFNLKSRMELIQRLVEQRKEAAKKRKALNEAEAKYRQENPLISNILDNLHETNTFAADLKTNLHNWGTLTERQGAALIAMVIKDHFYQIEKARRAEATKDAEDVPTGKGIEITGKIISVKDYEDKFNPYGGYIYKMLVQSDKGFRVFGTLPASLDVDSVDRRVKFIANITPSDDDPKFGFFSRPRKAEYID